jgi:hypothetical protein
MGSDAVVGVRICFVGDGVPSFAVEGGSVGSGRGAIDGAAVIGGKEQVKGMTLAVAKHISRSASSSSCD